MNANGKHAAFDWVETAPLCPVDIVPRTPRSSQHVNQGSPHTLPDQPGVQGGQSVHASHLSLAVVSADYNNNPWAIKSPSLITHFTTTSTNSTTTAHHRLDDQRDRLAARGNLAGTTLSSTGSAPPSSLRTPIHDWRIDPALGLESSISTLAVDTAESPTFAFTHQSPAAPSSASTPVVSAEALPTDLTLGAQQHTALLTPPDESATAIFAGHNRDRGPDSALASPTILKFPWSVSYSPHTGATSATLGSTLAVSATASTFSEAYSPRLPSWSAALSARPTPPGTARSSTGGWYLAVPDCDPQDPVMWVDRSPSNGISDLRSTMAAPAEHSHEMQPSWDASGETSGVSSESHEGDDSVASVLSRTDSFVSDSQQGPEVVMSGGYDASMIESAEQQEDSAVRPGELRRDWKFESPQRKRVPPPLLQSRSYTYGTSGQPPPGHYVPETSWQPVGQPQATPTSTNRGGFADMQMPLHDMSSVYGAMPNTPRQISPQEGLHQYVTRRPPVGAGEYQQNQPPPFGFVVQHSADHTGLSIPRLVPLSHGARAPPNHYYQDDWQTARGGEHYMTPSQYANYMQGVTLRPPQGDYQQMQQQNQAVSTSHLRSQSFSQAFQRQTRTSSMVPPVPGHHNVFSYVQPQGMPGIADSPHHSDVSLDSSHHKAHSVGSRSSAESLTSGSISYGHPAMQRNMGDPFGVAEQTITYTTDANIKQTEFLKRECFTCKSRDPPSWRRSVLDETRILCNRCGIFERSHGFARTPEMMGKPIAKPKHKIITGRIVKRKQSAAPDYEQDVPEDAVMMDRAIADHYRQDSYQSSGYTHSGAGSSFSPVTPWSSTGSWSGKTPNSANFKKRSRANTGNSTNDIPGNGRTEAMIEQNGTYPQTHARHDSLQSMSISYPPGQAGQESKPSIRLAHTARAPSWTGIPSQDEVRYGGTH